MPETTIQMDEEVAVKAQLRLDLTRKDVEAAMQNIKNQVSEVLHYGNMWKGASAVEFYEEFGKAGNAFNEQLAQMAILEDRLAAEIEQWKYYGHRLIDFIPHG